MSGTTSPRYPGSPPFSDSEIDRLLFRGRAAEAEELTAGILSAGLVVVYGVSGTGKTSLMQAGVFHRLREADLWPVTIRLNDPSRRPTELIAAAMVEHAAAEGLELLPADPAADDLWELLAGLEVWRGDVLLTPVVVLDQFEELFTLDWDPEERERFLTRFGWVTRGHRPLQEGGIEGRPPAVKSVILIREDSLGELESVAAHVPHILSNRFRLVALDLDQATEAIRGPAALVDERLESPPFAFADDAVELLLDFLRTREERGQTVKSNAVEPSQLQIICQYVEDVLVGQLEGVVVTAANLGGRDGLIRILGDFYRRAIAALPDEHEPAARELAEAGLINAAGRRLSREVGEIEEAHGVPEAMLDRLVEARLLRAERRTGSRYFELAHDSLVRPILDDRAARLQQEAEARRRRLRRAALGAGALVFSVLLGWALVATFQDAQEDESRASLVAAAAELVTRDAELTLTGTVTGHDGAPLSGASVQFHAVVAGADADAGVAHATTTNQTGEYTVLLTEGEFRMRVSAPGYVDAWYNGASSFETATDIEIGRGATPGELDVALTAAPGAIRFSVLAGEKLVAVRVDGEEAVRVRGPGSIEVPTPGTYSVEFAADGYGTVGPVAVTLGLGGTEDLGEIVLAATGADATPVTFLMLFNGAEVIEVRPDTPITPTYIVSNNGETNVLVTGIDEPWRDDPVVAETVELAPGESATITGASIADPVASGCDLREATLVATTPDGTAIGDDQGGELTAAAEYCVADIATITGIVFRDVDGDGAPGGDGGIAGVAVTLDSGAGLERATTAADGTYEFEVAAGKHTVAVQPPASTAPTTSVTVTVEPAAGDVATVDFGFQDVFTISGITYRDTNGDGARDPGEPGVEQGFVYVAPGGVPANCTAGAAGGTEAPQSVETGDDGSFQLVVTRGDYAVTIAGACDAASQWAAGQETIVADVLLGVPPATGLDTVHRLPAGLLCRNMAAVGYGAADAVAYWEIRIRPTRMDADGNGRPCETVFEPAAVAAALANRRVVVVGTDTSLESSADEVERLDGTIYEGSTRIYRQGDDEFVTVVVGFGSEESASRAVGEIASRFPANRGVFATRLADVCPRETQRDGYVDCTG